MSKPAKAQFEAVDPEGLPFDVMFNPTSLKVSLTNRLQDEKSGSGQDHKAKQNTQGTTSKLETELIFDTTELGTDVRAREQASSKLRSLASTIKGAEDRPPRVKFRWGRFAFTGVIESLTETLDFWSSEGVPLRSTMQVVIQGVEGDTVAKNAPAKEVKVVMNRVPPGGRGATGAATNGGDPRAGRALAAANGVEDMRMAAGGGLTVSGGVELKAAAGFSLSASAGPGASIGFGAGASAGASAGLEAGASAGFGAGAAARFGAGASPGFGAGAGAGVGSAAGFGIGAAAGVGAGAMAEFGAGEAAGVGVSASAGYGGVVGYGSLTSDSSSRRYLRSASYGATATAGVSATQGAFAGLGASKTATSSVRIDPARFLPPPSATSVGSAAQCDITGRLVSGGSAGLSADVRAGVQIL
jgi:hypothetical protein